MRVASQIFNTVLDTLETRKSSCHSLVFQAIGCVKNINSTHGSNLLYPANFMSKFPWYSIYNLWRTFLVKRIISMTYFSYVESVLKGVSTFMNFPFGNHSFTSSIIWSVWSTLKPRGDCKIHKFRQSRTDPSCTLISKASSKTLLSSGNYVS